MLKPFCDLCGQPAMHNAYHAQRETVPDSKSATGPIRLDIYANVCRVGSNADCHLCLPCMMAALQKMLAKMERSKQLEAAMDDGLPG